MYGLQEKCKNIVMRFQSALVYAGSKYLLNVAHLFPACITNVCALLTKEIKKAHTT